MGQSPADCLPTRQARKKVGSLRRYALVIIDEVGYLPVEANAANLFLHLVSSRYKHASLILTSKRPFSDLGNRARRPNRQRRHDQLHRPARRGNQPQRQQLSPPQQRNLRPAQHKNHQQHDRLNGQKPFTIRTAKIDQDSSVVDIGLS